MALRFTARGRMMDSEREGVGAVRDREREGADREGGAVDREGGG